jgi:hypothetical protein
MSTGNVKKLNATTRKEFVSSLLSLVDQPTPGNDLFDTFQCHRGTRLMHVDHFFHNLIFISCATAMRYMKLCIYHDSTTGMTSCGPLPASCHLSTIYRAHPFPFPVRTYDVMPLTLRSCAKSLGVIPREYGAPRCRQKISSDIFFMSILNRLTGRTGVYSSFREHFYERHEVASIPIIPRRKEIKAFLKYVDDNGAHRQLFSHQHLGSLPVDLTRHFTLFSSLVQELSESCDSVLDQLQNATFTRMQVVKNLGDYFLNAFEKYRNHLSERVMSRDKPDFLAHQVVSDLEEIYFQPFGDCDSCSVVFGYGAKQGASMCREIFSSSCHNELIEVNGKTKDAILLDVILHQLHKYIASDQSQSANSTVVLGCKVDKSQLVTVALNDRPLCPVDAEHFLCKLYIAISKTLSVRSSSKTPVSCKPGLHPVCFLQSEPHWDDEHVRTIMMDIIESFDQATKDCSAPLTPSILLLNGETLQSDGR